MESVSLRVRAQNEESGGDDLHRLYSKRILALATGLADSGRLYHPQATVMKRSPLCGSTVTVDLRLRDGRVEAYSQDVKACALGQASAAVLGRRAAGRTPAELETARDQLRAMLKEGGPPPKGDFSELEALLPARDFRNRHASIMLACDAVTEAAQMATAA